MTSERERRARAATTVIFFLTGWVYAAWATRIPAIKQDLRLSDGELGLAILGLGGSLAVMAAGTSVVDVAMNAQGVELERRYERPILSGLHAGHPFGLAAGGLAGTLAAGGGGPVRAHLRAGAPFSP